MLSKSTSAKLQLDTWQQYWPSWWRQWNSQSTSSTSTASVLVVSPKVSPLSRTQWSAWLTNLKSFQPSQVWIHNKRLCVFHRYTHCTLNSSNYQINNTIFSNLKLMVMKEVSSKIRSIKSWLSSPKSNNNLFVTKQRQMELNLMRCVML